MPLKPAASARCTRLAAKSRSVGVYSWKKPGVSANSAATSSIGSTVSVEATIGTPVRAAARAVARSPCPSWAHNPITPMGAMNTGDGSVSPNSSTDRSRSFGADEHPRDQSPIPEGLAVGPLGALVARRRPRRMTTPTAAVPLPPWLPVPRTPSAVTAPRPPGPAGRSRSDSRRMPCDEHASRWSGELPSAAASAAASSFFHCRNVSSVRPRRQ